MRKLNHWPVKNRSVDNEPQWSLIDNLARVPAVPGDEKISIFGRGVKRSSPQCMQLFEVLESFVGEDFVVSFREAMSFVNSQHQERNRIEQLIADAGDRCSREELLGRHVDDSVLSVERLVFHRSIKLLTPKEARDGLAGTAVEVVRLVLHEADERRDDDGSSSSVKSRNLVDDGFAKARAPEHHAVLARQQGLNGLELAFAELTVTKISIKCLLQRSSRLLCSRHQLWPFTFVQTSNDAELYATESEVGSFGSR